MMRNPKSNTNFLRCSVSEQLFQRMLKVFNSLEKPQIKLCRAHSNTGTGIITLFLKSFERYNPQHRLFQIPANISGSNPNSPTSYINHFPKNALLVNNFALIDTHHLLFKSIVSGIEGASRRKCSFKYFTHKNIK